MKTNKRKITAILLAGGKSSRMGTDKGIVEVNGVKMIESIILAVKPVVNEIIIIANNDHYDYLGYSVYNDLIKESGPLAGIYTGLFYSNTETNLVISCDVPFVNEGLLSYIVDNAGQCEVAVPVHNGKTEPLCAVYSKKCLDSFNNLITNKELKMHNVLNYFLTKQIFISEKLSFYNSKLFTNVNSLNELSKLKEIAI